MALKHLTTATDPQSPLLTASDWNAAHVIDSSGLTFSNGSVQTVAAQSRTIVSVSSGGTLSAASNTDYVYLVTGTNTQTLPTAVSNTNRYTIKNASTGVVTLNTTSSQTIDGSTSITIDAYTSVDVISNNANWNII
jgi:hypothetical protein